MLQGVVYIVQQAATTTWNPSDLTAGISLSNSNLTASGTVNADSGVRSTTSHNSGKWYVEFTTGNMAGSDVGLGIATSTATLTSIGTSAVGGAISFRAGGSIYVNGTSVGSDGAGGSNIACMALDLGNQRIWFRTNNGIWNNSGANNPATNVGGLDISSLFPTNPAYLCFCSNLNGSSVTINVGGTAFTYFDSTVSGFSAWG